MVPAHVARYAMPPGRSPAALASMTGSSTVVAAIDQGTTSTRCMLFDHDARVVARRAGGAPSASFPRPGWVEHDAAEIWANTRAVLAGALARAELRAGDVAADRDHQPARDDGRLGSRAPASRSAPAIVWQDTRTQAICDELGPLGGGAERYRARVGLPLATYFAGPKVRWMLDNVDGARERAERGELAFGTIDSWLLWNLTGGPDGGVHVTDATNASRTMLMDLDTLQWDAEIAAEMGVPHRDASGDPGVVGGVRDRSRDAARSPGCRSRASSATSRPRRSGRPACARRGQEHLRHRQLPAAEHRHRARCSAATAC